MDTIRHTTATHLLRAGVDLNTIRAEAMNIKVDRIGRYLSVVETRATHCKKESARLAALAKRAESKIGRTKQMVLYYLESYNLARLETDVTTLRGQKNSQDSVIVTSDAVIPADLMRYELKVDGELWMKLFPILPEISRPLSNRL
jgi:Siphovirus Gp157